MRQIAYANVALHLFGLLLGATAMRPGSIAEPLDARTAYLAGHPGLWQLGWGVWMLSALTFVAFMERLVRQAPAARLALVLGAMGASVDLLCDALQMCVLPQFAGHESFLACERIANLGGLVVANGLYSLAVLVATLEVKSHLVAALGSATFVAGALMVAGGILDAPQLVVLSAAPTILAYCGWVIAVKDEARALGDGAAKTPA